MQFRTRSADPSRRRIEVPPGTTLLDAARGAGLPVARACGGGGLCGRCGLEVLSGGEALDPPDEAEQRVKQRERVPAALRLACRVEIRGHLEVTAGYW